MLIDATHRDGTKLHPQNDYDAVTGRLTTELNSIQGVLGLLLCGSLAKNDVVSGWSDLDFVVFLDSQSRDTAILREVGEAIERAKASYEIGLGLDIVFEDELTESGKLCGRPLAMTLEVSRYGILLFGQNLIPSVTLTDRTRETILNESRLAIRAGVHNWRRAYLSRFSMQNWPSYCVKTVLKLLKSENDPSIGPVFTYQAALEELREKVPAHPALPAFALAVRSRSIWPTLTAQNFSEILSDLEKSLLTYRFR